MWRRAISLLTVLFFAGALASNAIAAGKFKNLKVLKDAEVMKTMTAWNKALGMKCTDCHKNVKTADQDDHPNKAVALKMAQMQDAVNGKLTTAVKMTCFGCHRGKAKPGAQPEAVAGADKADAAVTKNMKDVTEFLKTQGLKTPVTCGTCHFGQGKVPVK